MPSRWDYLQDIKPRPLVEHLLEEVSKLLAKDLERWPPPLEAVDASLVDLIRGPRPSRLVYRESFRLARWELERETAAYDDYMRNKRWLEKDLAPTDKPALLFLSQWLLEKMLGLAESTEGRVKRPQLVDCLERTERRLTY